MTKRLYLVSHLRNCLQENVTLSLYLCRQYCICKSVGKTQIIIIYAPQKLPATCVLRFGFLRRWELLRDPMGKTVASPPVELLISGDGRLTRHLPSDNLEIKMSCPRSCDTIHPSSLLLVKSNGFEMSGKKLYLYFIYFFIFAHDLLRYVLECFQV